MPAEIIRKLEESRIELLDLSLRNPFLNYRPLKSKGLEIINEISAEVYWILVKEEKSMIFDPVKKETDEPGDPDDILTSPESEDMTKDNKLQTPVTKKELQIKLLNTYYAARTFIEEQGVNNLFLTLGMLKWQESNNAEKELSAPCLLIPVELIRTNAREVFRIKYTGEEIQENLSLIMKLSNEHGIKIPSFNDSEEQDINRYLEQFKDAIERNPNWRVEMDSICIGFFSFGKYLMYKDLDSDTWPENLKPDSNSILESLLVSGFRDCENRISENEQIDKFFTPQKTNHVMDADSTQMLALSDVQAGLNLVIQGPPGTGKSQTITNIIADAIDAGRKVLFVSEKMAALEVVKRRLDKIGLGDACLELHSQKANKKTLLSEIKRVYELGEPKLNDISAEKALLLESRDKLNDYCEALNMPIADSFLTPIQIYGILLSIKREKPDFKFPDISVSDMAKWEKDDYKRREAIIKDYDAHLKSIGAPRKHPFWGSGRKAYLPTEEPRLNENLLDAQKSHEDLQVESQNTARALLFDEPIKITDIEKIIRVLFHLSKAPDLTGIQISNDLWKTNCNDILKSISSGRQIEKLKSDYKGMVIPLAWTEDVVQIRQVLGMDTGKWWRFLSGKYRAAKRRLAALCQNGLPGKYNEWISICDAINEYQMNSKVIEKDSSKLKDLFGNIFNGEESSWEDIKTKTDWIVSVYEDIRNGKVPGDFLIKFEKMPDTKALNKENLENALKKYVNAMDSLLKFLEIDQNKAFAPRGDWKNISLDEQKDCLASWKLNSPKIQDMVVFNHFAELLQKESLERILSYSISENPQNFNLSRILLYNWCESLLNLAFTERPVIAQFSSDKHESVLNRFKEYDKLLISHNQVRLAQKHWSSIPKGNNDSGQLGVLLWEFQKKSRHLPIRQLMLKAGNAIQAIKPVFMMSPISIANFLSPESIRFDLIIFDEASQVKPVEAFGAILRGKQIVVVGDSKQLPPTSFFDQTIIPEGEGDDFSIADVESVLALFEAKKAPQRMLRWHYRSRHESLIAVSNYEFYDNKLVIFPSPQNTNKKIGLSYNYLSDGAYDRSNTRVNIPEAKYVAQKVMQHAKKTPELTLGVAAFSMSQMQAILDEIELLRRKDISSESFFNMHPHEPFFVKNLENVQGDERDVIFISVGYGKTKEGYLSMNFGPLNNEGGERRLNVLISRARMRCEVFTNLAPEDIDLSRSSAQGVKALKTFLTYARDGNLNIPVETDREEDSPFEEEVFKRLTGLRFTVRKQVGCAGFYIDLAVVDPNDNNRYVLGIECDGASYHSARSARDRDRLRQLILEEKGWNIHRIWSTDWFRNPENELRKAAEAIEKARVKSGHKASANSDSGVQTTIERKEPQAETDNIEENNKYVLATLPFIDEKEIYSPVKLVPHIERIVEVESPVHILEVSRRILSFSKMTRAGSAISKCINDACILSTKDGRIVKKGEFLWLGEMKTPVVRDRSGLPSNCRKIELIAKEEICLAIIDSIKKSFGLEKAELAATAGQGLGFSRVNEDLKAYIDNLVDEMLEKGILKENGLHVLVNEG